MTFVKLTINDEWLTYDAEYTHTGIHSMLTLTLVTKDSPNTPPKTIKIQKGFLRDLIGVLDLRWEFD